VANYNIVHAHLASHSPQIRAQLHWHNKIRPQAEDSEQEQGKSYPKDGVSGSTHRERHFLVNLPMTTSDISRRSRRVGKLMDYYSQRSGAFDEPSQN
jgi:hypothetical protein